MNAFERLGMGLEGLPLLVEENREQVNSWS